MNAHPSLVIGEPIEIRDAMAGPDAMVRFENISKTYPAYRGKAIVVVLIALVQLVQSAGDYLARRVNRRLRHR